jgi:hypothetical protein
VAASHLFRRALHERFGSWVEERHATFMIEGDDGTIDVLHDHAVEGRLIRWGGSLIVTACF